MALLPSSHVVATSDRFTENPVQFKSPEYTEKWNRFTIRLSPPQHQILQRLYPQKAAYYVAHMFTSLKAVNEEQSNPRLKEARDFLRNFLCIDVRSLPPDARSIHYIKPESHRNSPEPSFKTKADGNSRDDVHSLVGDAWERGSTLFEKLTSGEMGVLRDLSVPLQATHDGRFAAQGSEIDSTVSELSANDLGLFIRIPQ